VSRSIRRSLSEDVLAGGSTFRIPQGLLGIECEFGFVMARDFPASGETPDAASLRSAIAECFIGLELVGRPLSDDVPLNETSAIADFALDVAVIRGEPIPDWTRCDLAAMPVRAVLDGITVVTSTGAAVLGNPLNALLWLAETLQRHGGALRRGGIIMTGTCTGITNVTPGQTFAGRFADFLAVQVSADPRSDQHRASHCARRRPRSRPAPPGPRTASRRRKFGPG
jgi:2-keto-4-pentenoate hydratase